MKLEKRARVILSVTALAWSIPFAHAGTTPSESQIGMPQASAEGMEFKKLDANRDGYLSYDEVRNAARYRQQFTQADLNHDGRLDPNEAVVAGQLHDRAVAERYARDSWLTAKVKVALLRERGLNSTDVNVETSRQRVLLSGFVASDAQKRKALLVASNVDGVRNVEDGLIVR
jgi:hypothetical protein